jgi:hypothetical protein
LWVGFLAVLVVGPWLLPGYIFGTDFAGDRRFDFPTSIHSYAAFEMALALFAKVFSAEATAKLLIFSSLFAAGLGAFRALPYGGFMPRAIASVVYMLNPFVYGRLLYGQLGVVAAYAILPWIVLRTRRLIDQPTIKQSVANALVLVVVGILELHMLLLAGLLMASLVLTRLVKRRRDFQYLLRLGLSVLAAFGIAVLASLYWLIPLVLGINDQGKTLQAIGPGDLAAFRVVPDAHLGLVPNLLGLYGFWAEDVGRFASMKQFVPWWPIALAGLLVLAALGGATSLAGPKEMSQDRAWVSGLLLAAFVAVVLEVGVADPHVARFIQWLDSVFRPYRGLRDSGKWAAVLAVVYSQLVPIGAMAILAWTSGLGLGRLRDAARGLVAGLAVAVPLYYGNGLLYGAHNQIRPSQYPAGWYEADVRLLADSHPGRVAFLPWHLYLSLHFVRNADTVILSPAPEFFSVPIVLSNDPELPGVRAPLDSDQTTISGLVRSDAAGAWGEVLATRGIKYVLLAKEVDWKKYDYLNRQNGLIRVADYGSIVLYRNLLVN